MRYQWCLTPIISIVASYEVAKAVRYLSGKGYSKQLITIDAFNFKYEALNIDILKNKDCPVYEKEHYKLLETKQESNIESMCGNACLFRFPQQAFEHAEYFPGNIVKSTSFTKLIHYASYEFTLFKDGRMNAYGIFIVKKKHMVCITLY